MTNLITYLLQFILGEGNEPYAACVSYGPSDTAAVVIQPSRFFDDGFYLSPDSLPRIPLAELDGIPILYGEPQISEENGQLILHADLIASAYFLLSRYEECVNRAARDAHGRFPVEQSLPYRAGFLHRPIVEEYGALLRRLLRQQGIPVQEPPAGYSHIYLTHDVDHIVTWPTLRSALRSTAKRLLCNETEKRTPLAAYGDVQKDPIFTFPWFLEQDSALAAALPDIRTEQVYFLLGSPKGPLDDEYLDSPQFEAVLSLLRSHGVTFGLHNSYQASQDQSRTAKEKVRIEARLGMPIQYQRSHVLASREPEDMEALISAGITDDFTMGYAGRIGFRLGTCRAVRWIDPMTRAVTSLTLHPLTAMDCTLDAERYMALPDVEFVLAAVRPLLETIHRYGGEVNLLWHNSTVPENAGNYHRQLYPAVLRTVADIENAAQK